MGAKPEKAPWKRTDGPKRDAPERQQAESLGTVPGAHGPDLSRMGNRALASMLRAGQLQTKEISSDPALASQMSGGSNLDPQTLDWMESRLGASFDEVRIHTGSHAAQMAETQQARAFTVGRDIVFSEGQFAPQTTEGKRLLAHELAHVVQQRGTVGAVAGETSAERDADEAAHAVANGGKGVVMERAAPGTAQRQERESLFTSRPGVTTSTSVIHIEMSGVSVHVEGRLVATGTTSSSDHPRDDGGVWDSGTRTETIRVFLARFATLAPTRSAGDVVRDLGMAAIVIIPIVDAEEQSSIFIPPSLLKASPTPKPKPAPPPPKAQPETQPAPVPQIVPETIIYADSDLIKQHTSSWGNLDEAALGKTLLDRAIAGDSSTVEDTLDTLFTDRDDVSFSIVSQATDDQLDILAQTEDGRKLLLHLYDELTSGPVSDDEANQSQRVLMAWARRIDPEKIRSAKETAMVIPFSGIGFTNFSSASVSASRLPNGKIWVRSHMKQEHWKDAKRLPSAGFAAGLGREFDPDEVVGIHFYDDGGKTVYVPAMFLLQLSNQEDKSAVQMMSQAVVTGLTLGAGGAGAVAGRITIGRVATGMGLGAGFNAVGQGLDIYEDPNKDFKDFSGIEVGKGALIGGGLVFVPQLGAPLLAGGAVGGATKISEGHYLTGGFALGSAALPFAAPKVGQWALPRIRLLTLVTNLSMRGVEDIPGLSGRNPTAGIPYDPGIGMVVDTAGRPLVTNHPNIGSFGLLSAPGVTAIPGGVGTQAPGIWKTAPIGNAPVQPYQFPVVVRLTDPVDAALSPGAPFQVGSVNQVNRVRTTSSGRQLISLDTIALTQTQRLAATAIHGQQLPARQQQAWANTSNGREQVELAEIQRLWNLGTPEAQQQARELARASFDRHRSRYWAAVRRDPQLRADFDASGMQFVGTNSSAPVYTLPDGTVARMTLEHSTRLADDPVRALSGNNLQFVLDDENSVFLEFIRANDPFQR